MDAGEPYYADSDYRLPGYVPVIATGAHLVNGSVRLSINWWSLVVLRRT
jgi:hypothetical protein